jgi:hypothetical protein
MSKAEEIFYKHLNSEDVKHVADKSFLMDRLLDAINEALSQHDVIKNEVAVCSHPIEKRIGWHDSAILCDECDCIIEQYGKEINPPTKIY